MSGEEPGEWQRSSYCDAGNCVEAAALNGGVVVRDSKNPDGPILHFNRIEWDSFITGVRNGEFTFH